MAEAGEVHTRARLYFKDKAPGHAEIIDFSGNAMVKCSCDAREKRGKQKKYAFGVEGCK